MKKILWFLITVITFLSCDNSYPDLVLNEESNNLPIDSIQVNDSTIIDTLIVSETSSETMNNAFKRLSQPFKNYQYYSCQYHQVLGINVFAPALLCRRAGANTFIPYSQMQQNATTKGLYDIYQSTYIGVDVSNIILSTIDSTLIDENSRNVRGFAKFTRAVHYFNFARLFGKVPIVTEPFEEGSDFALPRAETIEEVYDLIEKDLLDAFELLQEVQFDKAYPSKWAAKAFLAKMYLQLASNSLTAGVGTGNSDFWIKARDYAMEVINGGAFGLEIQYKNLFGVNEAVSDESIFEIEFTRGYDTGSVLHLSYVRSLWWHNG
jgi:hypothetical protein